MKFCCPNCKYELDWEVLDGEASLKCPKCGQTAHVKVGDRDAIREQKKLDTPQ